MAKKDVLPIYDEIADCIRKHPNQFTYNELLLKYKNITKEGLQKALSRRGVNNLIVHQEERDRISSSTLKGQPMVSKKEITEVTRLEVKIKQLTDQLVLSKKKETALKTDLLATERALGDALGLASHKPKTFKITAVGDKEKKAATAVALLSDVHCEEIIQASKVNYLNKHNPDISKKRLTRFFQLLVKFIRLHRRDSNIDNLVLWLGGDFFTGSESHGTPVAFGDSEAVLFAQDMIVSGIKFIREQMPELKIHIVGSVGNHSRKNQTKPINTAKEQEISLEWIMYHTIRQIFADDENLTFQFDNSYHSYVKVYDKTIRFNHGHLGFRYNKGLAGIHGPLWKAISETWDNQIAADLTCIGHYHSWTPASLARPYMVNGSTIGLSPYGAFFGNEPPSQMMFLVHRRYGFIEQTPLFVDS